MDRGWWPESSNACAVRSLGARLTILLPRWSLVVPLPVDMKGKAMSIPAKYNGLCVPCGEDINQGDPITLHPDAGYVHEDCAEDVGKVAESNGADFNPRDRGRAPGIAVMPRGRTTKDRCDRCFQVPASNGACGC